MADIEIDPTSNKYDLGVIRIGNQEIVCEDFNFEISTEPETKNATNSREPIGYKGGKNEYTWEANGVVPEAFDFLRAQQKCYATFSIAFYHFGDCGQEEETGSLLNCRITDVNYSQEDEGVTLDVSGSALNFEDAKGTDASAKCNNC